ncbi:MAG: hypothetical protein JW774_06405 [Candidatus Aureabacteria bacterium]|nr:hypothetical protein [Candidatus Auribacterota bacterium]
MMKAVHILIAANLLLWAWIPAVCQSAEFNTDNRFACPIHDSFLAPKSRLDKVSSEMRARTRRKQQYADVQTIEIMKMIKLPPEIKREIISRIRWEVMPGPGEVSGRNVIITLKKPLLIGGRRYKAIRIKGIVYKDGETGEVSPPIMESFNSGTQPTEYQILRNGKIEIRDIHLSPKGGMYLEQAENNFLMNEDLNKLGLTTLLPIGYGCYPNMSLHDKQIGFVIYGVEETTDARLEDDIRKMRRQGLTETRPQTDGIAEFIREYSQIMYRFGRRLRQMHDAGYAHFATHINNAYFSGDEIYFCDLDHVRKKTGKRDSKPFSFFQFRDYKNAISSLQRKFMPIFFLRTRNPDGTRFSWRNYSQFLNLYYGLMEEYQLYPHYSFMAGYFHDDSSMQYQPGQRLTRQRSRLFSQLSDLQIFESDMESFEVWRSVLNGTGVAKTRDGTAREIWPGNSEIVLDDQDGTLDGGADRFVYDDVMRVRSKKNIPPSRKRSRMTRTAS